MSGVGVCGLGFRISSGCGCGRKEHLYSLFLPFVLFRLWSDGFAGLLWRIAKAREFLGASWLYGLGFRIWGCGSGRRSIS